MKWIAAALGLATALIVAPSLVTSQVSPDEEGRIWHCGGGELAWDFNPGSGSSPTLQRCGRQCEHMVYDLHQESWRDCSDRCCAQPAGADKGVNDSRKAVKDAAKLTQSYILKVAAGAIGIALVCGLFPDLTFTKACAGAFASFGSSASYVSLLLTLIANDPPDHHFSELPVPRSPDRIILPASADFPPSLAQAFNNMLDNQARAITYSRLLLASLERSSGAAEADSMYWYREQLKSAADAAGKLADVFRSAPYLLRYLTREVESARFPNRQLSQEEITNAIAKMRSGLIPSLVTSALSKLGASSAEIVKISSDLASVEHEDINLYQTLASSSLRESLLAVADALEAFRRSVERWQG